LGIRLLPEDVRATYQIEERHHACAILKLDFPAEWDDLIAVLRDFTLKKSAVQAKGGRKSPIAESIDGLFAGRKWIEKNFEINVTTDGVSTLPQRIRAGYCEYRIIATSDLDSVLYRGAPPD
jgi:hypothetical protein